LSRRRVARRLLYRSHPSGPEVPWVAPAEIGALVMMNIASAITAARYRALLIETEGAFGLEPMLVAQGCQVRKVSLTEASQEPFQDLDLVVISAANGGHDVVLDVASKAAAVVGTCVVTEQTDLAVKAGRLGASSVIGSCEELVALQIAQILSVVELKRRVTRPHGLFSMTPPSSGIVHRRSSPLPKEATPEALDLLIEAAEGLVSMHRFQRVYVDYALRRFGGNKVHTAAALGIDRRTIQRWARARSEQPASVQEQLATS